ncbi:TetR/AcrR family transcriptional regulator [Ulvibacterium sp.]|uniref:TetR/AcrR family transcriptional regulator n=1 Tax=Ulvibacterium sp. TaxID=2665914 RepID=UPI003BA9097D
MRPQKVLDKDILIGLTKVFRSKGYEGASLKELAEATGLKKASLYHRFPNGKKEMAEAVFAHVGKWVDHNVFEALLDERFTPKERIKNGLNEIRTLYDHGNEVCIFRALSMQTGLELFEKQVNSGMNQWINVFNEVGLALGFSTADSQKKAVQVLIEIQGSLIVSKGLGDISVFEKTLQNIEIKYING